jgi:hypothetical protein
MKLYSSFLIRSWLIRELASGAEAPDEKFVFDIEHIQNGEHLRAANPAEALEWMMARLRAEHSSNDDEADDQSAE